MAVGEGQSLGNRLDYGGPSFGFLAAREEHIRRMPGRIAGETRDVDGRRGFVLTLQTREQHIRREKATHNICTAQVLNALAGVIHLSWLGKRGAVELAELMLRRADYARTTLAALPGVRALHEQPVAREFALALDAPVEAVIERCAAEGVNPGLRARARTTPSTPTACWWRSPSAAAAPTSTAWPTSSAAPSPPSARPAAARGRSRERRRADPPAARAGRRRSTSARAPAGAPSSRPTLDVPERPLDELLPARLRRAAPPELPEVAEPEIVRHYNRPQQAQLRPRHRLLPAGLLHDEAQPQAARAGRRAAGPRAPAPAPVAARAPRGRSS